MFIFGTKAADLKEAAEMRCVCQPVSFCVQYLLSFLLSYFLYSLHHLVFKWVSEESGSLPQASELINSTTHTQKQTPTEACVILNSLKW